MQSFSRVGGAALRRAIRSPIRVQKVSNGVIVQRTPVATASYSRNANAVNSSRSFHTSISFRGIMPEAADPEPRDSEDLDQPTVPTDISTTEFHERANEYLDELVNRLEEEQEKTPELEVEYSAGVLEVKITSRDLTYVLNKQPPNKQIWLSSPISGPKRFDWVVSGEAMHQKEGGGVGDWIYLRDGASLTDIVRKELGVALGKDDTAPQ